jgi:hypothetical protein
MQTDGLIDMTELTDAFSDYANAHYHLFKEMRNSVQQTSSTDNVDSLRERRLYMYVTLCKSSKLIRSTANTSSCVFFLPCHYE